MVPTTRCIGSPISELADHSRHGIAALILAAVAAILPSSLAANAYSAETKRKPNIVLILADDLGYGDIGCYGNTVNRTPHLDYLAAEGLRFTDFHSNGPMCTPTRAALLTGRYQQRFGRELEGALSGKTQYDHGLPLSAVTVAEALRQAGYATGMYGKWHLGYHPPLMPTGQGFDDYRGLAGGGGDHHSHIDRSGRPDWWHNERLEMEIGYSADLITRHSIEFIRQHKDEPFLLYVPHQVIHFPWQGPDEQGYRVEGQSYWDLSKLGRLTDTNVGPLVKQMVEALDNSVGHIVATLRQLGLAERTLVFFTSDNGGYLRYGGGYHNISSNGPLRGQKGDVYEGGHRVPAIAWWPGRIKPGTVTDQTTATFDLFPTLLELAGLANRIAPLQLDGTSMAPLLAGGSMPSRSLFWRMGTRKAVRRGPWKLVLLRKRQPELFNLGSDIGETQNLAEEHPEIVNSLQNALQAWEQDVDE